MTPTVIKPANPELPSDVTRPCMFPMTSTGTNTTSDPKRTCSTIASPNRDTATAEMPPIQDLIVEITFSPAIWYIPPLVGLCCLTYRRVCRTCRHRLDTPNFEALSILLSLGLLYHYQEVIYLLYSVVH